jgi:hypothetical protein
LDILRSYIFGTEAGVPLEMKPGRKGRYRKNLRFLNYLRGIRWPENFRKMEVK